MSRALRHLLFGAVCGVAVATTARMAAQERPTFRSGIDVIQLDVSVIDNHRRPVRGLAAGDFTILEDGKPQRLIAFNAIDIPDPVVPSAPWIRDVAPDVRANTRQEGRLFVVLMDDGLIPFEPWMINHALSPYDGTTDRDGALSIAGWIVTIRATTTASWIHITTPMPSAGDNELFFNVDANDTGVERRATIVAAGLTLAITQSPR